MTKRDEAVFVEAFDELEAEGFFDELRKKAQARELQGVKILKADKKSGKKIPASVSGRNVADKVPLAASKKNVP